MVVNDQSDDRSPNELKTKLKLASCLNLCCGCSQCHLMLFQSTTMKLVFALVTLAFHPAASFLIVLKITKTKKRGTRSSTWQQSVFSLFLMVVVQAITTHSNIPCSQVDTRCMMAGSNNNQFRGYWSGDGCGSGAACNEDGSYRNEVTNGNCGSCDHRDVCSFNADTFGNHTVAAPGQKYHDLFTIYVKILLSDLFLSFLNVPPFSNLFLLCFPRLLVDTNDLRRRHNTITTDHACLIV